MAFNLSSIQKWLSSRPALGVKLWILIVTCVLVFLLIIVILTFICLVCSRRWKRNRNPRSDDREAAIPGQVFTEMNVKEGSGDQFTRQGSVNAQNSIVTDWEHSAGRYSPAALKDGGRRSTFAMEEIALVTDGFSEGNVISIEDYGVNYFGNLADDTKVIVKIFNANNRCVLF